MIKPWIALALCPSLVSCAFSSRTSYATAQRNVPGNPDERFWSAVEKANVVYVGETHDDPADHEYETELIRGLLGREVKFAVGWEIFDKTQQSWLDAWASHKIFPRRASGEDWLSEELGNFLAGVCSKCGRSSFP